MKFPISSKESKKQKWNVKIGKICSIIEDELCCDCAERGEYPCSMIFELYKIFMDGKTVEIEEIETSYSSKAYLIKTKNGIILFSAFYYEDDYIVYKVQRNKSDVSHYTLIHFAYKLIEKIAGEKIEDIYQLVPVPRMNKY